MATVVRDSLARNQVFVAGSNTVIEKSTNADAPLTAAQQAMVAQLSKAQIQMIDDALMSNAHPLWRKVAFVVGAAMLGLPGRIPGLPDVFYAQRIRVLVAEGRLESIGNLSNMRFSEVRLPVDGACERSD